MVPNPTSHLPLWLSQVGGSRFKLVLLTGSCDIQVIANKVQRAVPTCVVLNVGLVLSQQLLDTSSQQRPAQAPVILASMLSGQAPAILHGIELLFEPTLQLEPLRALRLASRLRILFALWPGDLEGGHLTYAERGHPEYRRYGPADLAGVLVVPVTDLITEA